MRSDWLHQILVVISGAASAVAALYVFETYFFIDSRSRFETACASVLNVVNPEGTTFEREGSSTSNNDHVVRMLYSLTTPDGQSKKTVILCAFDTAKLSGGPPKLLSVSVNGNQLGPARLTFLNRFWLASDEAMAALPSSEPASRTQTRAKDAHAPG